MAKYIDAVLSWFGSRFSALIGPVISGIAGRRDDDQVDALLKLHLTIDSLKRQHAEEQKQWLEDVRICAEVRRAALFLPPDPHYRPVLVAAHDGAMVGPEDYLSDARPGDHNREG